MLRRYGITSLDLIRLLDYQEHKCAICPRELRSNNSCIDHDHTTGVTRGVLCVVCNRRLLPASRDSSVTLRRAAYYLDNPPAIRLLGKRIGTDPVLKGKPRRKKKRPTRRKP